MSLAQTVLLALTGGLFAGWTWEIVRLHRSLLTRARNDLRHSFPGLAAMQQVWYGFLTSARDRPMRRRLLWITAAIFAAALSFMSAGWESGPDARWMSAAKPSVPLSRPP